MAEERTITERFLAGERRALSRLVSWAEDGDPRFGDALRKVYPRIGRAYRVGVTGPPGAGKSTLVNALAIQLRALGKTVAILAIDPSSPFTGGALLGDRIRMEERTPDPGVFIRSMASRGSHGGLARAAVDACDLMDAFGFDVVLVETVGVGQAEYDVVSAADTVIVVSCPGAGDGIQAMKAGLLEVADVLCVNKADQPGAEALANDLEEAVHVRFRAPGTKAPDWTPPVVPAVAARGEGIEDVWQAVERHRAHLEEQGLAACRATKRAEQVKRVVSERLDERLWGPGGYGERLESELAGSKTPYDVAAGVLGDILPEAPGADPSHPEATRP